MIQACSWRGQWANGFWLFWGIKITDVCTECVYIYICIHTHTAIYNNILIGSMYGIYANIWGILMVNVTIYSIHGSYGIYVYICIYTNIDRSNQSCHFYHVIVIVVLPWRIHQRLRFWATLPLDVHGLPSGKHTKSYGKSPCLMVKSTR